MSERAVAGKQLEQAPPEIRRLSYPDLPQVIAIERRVFPTPWSLAMFVLELSKPPASAWPPWRRAARRLSDLLALRHGLARDEHRRRPEHQQRRGRLGAAGRAVRARRTTRTRATRWRCAAPTAWRSTSTSAKASARRARAGATTRTTARTRWSCGARRRRWRARSTTCRTPARYDDPRDRDQLRRHVRSGPRRDGRCAPNVISSQGVHDALRRSGPRDRLAPAPRAGQRVVERGARATPARRSRTSSWSRRRRARGWSARCWSVCRGQGAGRRPRAAVRARRPSAGPRRRQLLSPAARVGARAAVPVPDRQRRPHAARARERPRRLRGARADARRRRRRGIRQGREDARAGLSGRRRRSNGWRRR